MKTAYKFRMYPDKQQEASLDLTVRDLLIQRLHAMGADGLATEDCGCGIDDLAPCGLDCLDCEPAIYDDCADIWSSIDHNDRPACLWEEYQSSGSYEDCCAWLKHRALMKRKTADVGPFDLIVMRCPR